MSQIIRAFLFSSGFLFFTGGIADTMPDQADVKDFIGKMVKLYGFEQQQLDRIFISVSIKEGILKAISSPAEAKPWHQYRKIFLTESRINKGIAFWQSHVKILEAIEKKFGVPAEIIVAIIGVETQYGEHTGSYRVIDALSTLAFEYPKRSRFFRAELEQFLLLCREEGIDPTEPKGSYAGAMGIPQFIPSSYRRYSSDFDGDKRRDIWKNTGDVAASVANYFVVHGWRSGELVTFPVDIKDTKYKILLNDSLKPQHRVDQFSNLGIKIPKGVAPDMKAKLLELETTNGPIHWLGLHNFYVITRYNHSMLYAMAVYQLSQEILNRRTMTLESSADRS